ncbi:MAG: hypothetical protein ACRD4S_16805 [Candidatus Acidiferrales bacterium]
MIPYPGPDPPPQITQSDLTEEALLRISADEARQAWKKKHDEIRRLLEVGSPIEPGARRATLKKTRARMILR